MVCLYSYIIALHFISLLLFFPANIFVDQCSPLLVSVVFFLNRRGKQVIKWDFDIVLFDKSDFTFEIR